MAIDCENNIILESKGLQLKERQKVTISTQLNSEEVSKILSANGNFRVLEKEIQDGKIVYSGRVLVYFCYIDSEGEIKKGEAQTDFKGEINNSEILKDSKFFLISSCEKVEVESENIKLGFNLFGEINWKVFLSKSVPMLCADSDLITKTAQVEYTKSLCVGDTVVPCDNQFEVNYAVREVVSQKAKAYIKSVSCEVGKIEVSGEIFLSLILLQSGDKKGIIKESKVLPFTAQMECEESLPDCKAVAYVNQKSLRTDVSVDEEKNLSSISVSIVLELFGRAFIKAETCAIEDAFCLDKNTKCESKKEKYFCYGLQTSISTTIIGKANISEINVGSSLCAIENENFEIVSQSEIGNDISITGVYSCNGIFTNEEGNYFTRKMETPIEINLANCKTYEDYEITQISHSSSAKILSVNEVEISGELIFTICEKCSQDFTYISNIEYLGEKKCDNSAISVYIANNGESLWSISKRLNANPDELKLTNPELNFPLSGDERIVIYRQKK